jgi:hypothetical protein
LGRLVPKVSHLGVCEMVFIVPDLEKYGSPGRIRTSDQVINSLIFTKNYN